MESREANGSTGQLSSGGSIGDGVGATGMHHSHSTPAGVDGVGGGSRTPPATPKKGGKMLAIRVQMLDDTVTIFQVQAKALGQVLFDQVCKQLHLLEADYFGLEYTDMSHTRVRYWLDLQKPMSRQLGLSLVDPLLQFCVKFYTPDPGQLEEEYTRYLYCLQVKRDLAIGLMHCNDNTAALMASYIVQAECGDYVAEDYPDHTYLSSYKFVPHQDPEMERRIMENHKKHASQSPAEADLNLLETARRCELYGIKLHPAKDHENVPLNLAVAHMGIVVYQQITKINTFSWAKIRKLSFKRKKFLIKLHPEGYGYYKDTVEFFFEGRDECKNFWKKCVENHGFFRCSTVQYVSRHKTRVLSRGSSFRYSGKTQKQMVEFVRDNYVKRQTFQRSASFRHSSAHLNANNKNTSSVGNSISAHPLLPLADSNLSVEVSKLSASLGAMVPPATSASTTAVSYPRATGRTSPTTRSAYHHRGTPTCWSSAPDTRPTTLPARMTSSPSPPPTTRSGSPAISAVTSPQRTVAAAVTGHSPVAVRAAVHRADIATGTPHPTHHITTRTPCNRPPSQTQSQNDIDHAVPPHPQFQSDFSAEVDDVCTSEAAALPHVKRHVWRRSASCRDLYDFSFEDSGQAKRRVKPDHLVIVSNSGAAVAHELTSHLDERKLESPVTRYGDDHRAIYASSQNTSLEIHQDIMMPEQKVYSSSYPGTTAYSQESMEDPGNYELRDSQDDVSHDSYDLIERSDDECSTSGDSKYAKVKGVGTTRSCSLDSGRYIPSDSDSEADKHLKCKSSEDIHPDIFAMEDPRDFPREIVPRKSDGSFYKNLKPSSRTSSQESKSDYYDTRPVCKKRRSIGSRTSSQESKSDYETKKHTHRRKSNLKFDSRQSSAESKSEYYDAPAEPKSPKQDYDRHIQFERNYGTGTQKQRQHDNSEINRNYSHFKETSHVHSISLQNVETEQNIRANRMAANLEQNTVPRAQKRTQSDSADRRSITHIWPETIAGIPTQIQDWTAKQQSTKSTESESNIFSFDEERIKSMEESDDYAMVPTLPPRDIPSQRDSDKKNYRDVFVEIEPRKLDLKDSMMHQPIERTKSDPNNLAWQRLNSNSRRMLLKHQKSIDLTPAESSDEDYLYKQIPSAPPIMKYRGNSTHFEMPTAEFGHFDILKREVEGQKTRFEVPKKQFEVLGAKTQSDFINLPPKSETDIPYVLHKRHVMNGTSKEEPVDIRRVPDVVDFESQKKPKSPSATELPPVPTSTSFLFTQNIDLSKVDPVTLEIDKTAKPIHHLSSPKRDITRIDPAILETLNSKLSQIESDSPTSSRTESLKPAQKIKALQQIEEVPSRKPEIVGVKPKINVEKPPVDKIKTDIKPKRIIKSRMQPGKKFKGNKTKVRITSFSSDDESLDSDDVFGSAEATPTKLEFSPPQMRKEMESILKYESERKYLQYTMSSTEVEGSPPTTRRTDTLYCRNEEQPELRRISERSLSIPSSEDDFNIKVSDLPAVFEPEDQEHDHDEVTLTLDTLEEVDKEADKSIEDTVTVEMTEQVTIQEFLKEEDLKEIDEEKEKEKAQLLEDIEQDIRDLKVPAKTKITEICSPTSRRKGQSPMLFAHARLNLSEGSAFSLLQKQQALESPVAGRRAKSLDTPVISVNRLPPLNSFSSKDDTVEEEDDLPVKELPDIENEELPKIPEVVAKQPQPLPPLVTKVEDRKPTVVKATKKVLPAKQKSIEKDQIVPDVSKTKKTTRAATAKVKPTVKTKTTVTPPKPSTTKTVATAPKVIKKATTTVTTTVTSNTTTTSARVKPPAAATAAKPPVAKVKPIPPKSLSLEKVKDPEKKPEPVITQKSLPSQNSLQLPGHEIKRTKSQELESSKRPVTKEKAKSLEKLEFKRTSSKERTKSQDEEVDSAKRKEYQQMLYETAIKQTKTVKSPVKDIMPVFPQVEEMVRERGGKLEISINTIENTGVNLEEAIIITKSPKKLDKKLLDQKLTKSLELTLGDDDGVEVNGKSMQRLGKSLDLEPRIPSSEHFDFKKETIESMNMHASPDSPQVGEVVEEVVEADVHTSEPLDTDTEETLQDTEATQLVLEGTSLDVWISVDGTQEIAPPRGYEFDPQLELDKPELLKDITILEKSTNFFEPSTVSKPPDLIRLQETKSSSSSQSNERLSLGNSLEMKYADESGESSHRSDSAFVQELKKASQTVEKLLMKKLAKRRQAEEAKAKEIPEEMEPELHELQQTLVRITSEDESLTSVSDMKLEYQDMNFLGVGNDHKDALLKLSIERSRSEDTGSWMTVECDEYVGQESFEYDNAENLSKQATPTKDVAKSPTTDEPKNLLTAPTQNKKLEILKRSSDQSRSSDTGSWTSGEKDLSPGKTGDESSVSCSIGFAIGLSQTIEKFSTKEQLDKSSPELEPRSPRSPRSPRICVLGRTFTIDEDFGVKSGSSSEGDVAAGGTLDLSAIQEEDDSKKSKKPYPFEEKWSNESELTQRLQQKITKKLSSEKNSLSSVDDPLSDRRRGGGSLEKPSLNSVDRLSAESRNSVDTESSSGSFGLANRGGLNEMSCTWKRFPIGESGSASSSIDDVDPDFYAQEYFLSRESSADICGLDVFTLDPDATPTKETVDDNLDKFNYFPPEFNSSTYNTPNFLSRTLSRISERSSNSEKTDEDSIKASMSDASHEESIHQGTISSGSPSNAQGSDKKVKTLPKQPSKESEKFELPNMTNLLQRQISDDRRTSAEMAELSIDDIEIITSERGLRLKRQDSDDTIIDEDTNEKQSSSSQESDEWPLPDIPMQRPLMAMHETPSSDNSTQQTTQLFQPPVVLPDIPKVFGLRGSIVSQTSEQWPSPPSSVADDGEPALPQPTTAVKVETHYITPPEEACKVMVESNTQSYENDSNSLSDKTLEYEVDEEEKTHTYENVATDQISESISESLSVGPSGVKIVLEPKSGSNSNSDEFNVSNMQDDVFTTEHQACESRNELRPPTVMRRSTTSEDSSHSGNNNQRKKSKSHSSYSDDDEATSSMGTTLEDGTVRYAYQPTKCTHSSHSEDTSIALSLSEWSNSTTTVKFQNLSTSNSGKSSGLKSDDNSLTDIAHSISEWSSSNSNTLKAQSLQFQKLSSSTGDSSTLTDMMGKDWSTGSENIMAQSQFYSTDRSSLSRLGSSIEEPELDTTSPRTIASEELARFGHVISVAPVSLSDEKSSSSQEQRTVHTQRYDKEKQKYAKHQYQPSVNLRTSSVDRPVKVPLKLAKCSPYYSSSLSSESTPMTVTHPLPMCKTATIPLTRTHKKPVAKGALFQARSPPSENDSTSSMESAKCKSEPRRGYRRRRHTPQKRHKVDKDCTHLSKDDYFYVDPETTEYNEYIRNRSFEELACGYQYEHMQAENLEEGYYPDGDSQSGSDIFRMERDEPEPLEPETFDVSSIPPPLIEDDFEQRDDDEGADI